MNKIAQILLLAVVQVVVGCSTPRYQPSDHFDGKTFFNPGVKVNKGLFEVLKWQLQGGKEEWPDWVENSAQSEIVKQVSKNQVVLTYINHASYLIQLQGLNVLTDPIFSHRASPVSWAGPSRHRAPGVSFESLPKIDVVFISHNHYDHMDLPTIRDLAKRDDPLFVTPLGNQKILEEAGAKKIVELDWWQNTKLSPDSVLHLTQVQHWSRRGLFDTNEALWGGFVLQAQGMNLYFGGDTGYGAHFLEARKKFGPMDVSLLPIGAYEPRWFMKEQHMNPAEGIQAHQDLQSRLTLGIHFGTFQLTNESIDQHAQELQENLAKAQIDPSVFRAPLNGQTTIYQRPQMKSAAGE